MSESPRDLLLAADRAAQSRLDRIRADSLDRALASRWSISIWRAFAAAWLLIALLSALTPGASEADPRSVALAQARQLLSLEAATSAAQNSEPSDSPRIP